MDSLAKACVTRAQSALNMAMNDTGTRAPVNKFFTAARAILNDLDVEQKAAVGANTLSDFGDEAGQELISSFLGTIRHESLLDALAEFARPLPVGITRVLVASGAIASDTDEASPKAVTKLSLSLNDADYRKVAALIVFSDEVAKSGDPAARQMFEFELRNGVITASNTAALDSLTITPLASTGDTVEDLTNALEAADDSDGFVVGADPATVRVLALAFPESRMGVKGGVLIPGVRIVAVPDLPITVIPASRLSLRDFGMTVRSASHASITMADDPEQPGELVSLFQTNSVALLAERRFRLYGDSNAVQISEES